jgi:Sec-independent protein secretion pathway component TatC
MTRTGSLAVIVVAAIAIALLVAPPDNFAFLLLAALLCVFGIASYILGVREKKGGSGAPATDEDAAKPQPVSSDPNP